MKKIQILMSLGFMLLLPLTVLAEEARIPLPKQDIRTQGSTSDTQRGDIKKFKTNIKPESSWKPVLRRFIKRDPLGELQQAVQKIVDGDDDDCDSIRGRFLEIERLISECNFAMYNCKVEREGEPVRCNSAEIGEDERKQERAMRAYLWCDSYGVWQDVNQFLRLIYELEDELLKLVCGTDGYAQSKCFSESERSLCHLGEVGGGESSK